MDRKITFDFETRSKADIKVGAWRYSVDPSTEVLSYAVKVDDGPTKVWTPFHYMTTTPARNAETEKYLYEAIEDGNFFIEAHNSFFEYSIWNNCLAKKHAFPKMPLDKFHDTAALAAAFSLPRKLKDLAHALDLTKQKDMVGHRVMLDFSKAKKGVFLDPIENPEKFHQVISYNIDDVETEYAAGLFLDKLPWQERNLFLFDQEINLRGVPIDKKGVDRALKFIKSYNKELIEELISITEGAVTTGNQRDKMLKWLASRGLIMEKFDAAAIEEALKGNLEYDVARVLRLRQLLGKTSVKKLETMAKTMDESNCRVMGTLLYHGANTGRWAGRLIQPQNFPRGSIKDVDQAFWDFYFYEYEHFRLIYPDVLDALSSMLRGFICAPEGKEFVAADFSAIESRALFWLCSCVSGLEAYRTHGKIYEDMAAAIYNKTLEQILNPSFERQLGKQAVLGCGFGMGKKKFKITCEGYKMDVNDQLAGFAVSAFRTKYHEVVTFWKQLENAAIKAVKNPGRVFKANDKISYMVKDGFLWCRLPSGRCLSYYSPRLKLKEAPWGEMRPVLTYMGVNSVTRKWERQHTYGGKLCENVTQAVARDFMVHSMKNVDRAGYKIIMTVHDEIITEVDEGFGSLEEFESIMSSPPSWGHDCPINAEAWRGRRFRK